MIAGRASRWKERRRWEGSWKALIDYKRQEWLHEATVRQREVSTGGNDCAGMKESVTLGMRKSGSSMAGLR